jgi:hypothetical protein
VIDDRDKLNMIKKARASDYPTLEFKGDTLTVKQPEPSETWVFNWNPDGTLKTIEMKDNSETSEFQFTWGRDTLHSVSRTVKE